MRPACVIGSSDLCHIWEKGSKCATAGHLPNSSHVVRKSYMYLEHDLEAEVHGTFRESTSKKHRTRIYLIIVVVVMIFAYYAPGAPILLPGHLVPRSHCLRKAFTRSPLSVRSCLPVG